MDDIGASMRGADEEYVHNQTYEGLTVIGTYEKLTFFITDGPRYPEQVDKYYKDLMDNKVLLVVRFNDSIYDSRVLSKARITVLDMPYKHPRLPRESAIETLRHSLQTLFYKNKLTGVAFQGRDGAPLMIGFSMMVLGIDREDSINKIHELSGYPSEQQLRYLYRRDEELQSLYDDMRYSRRSDKRYACSFL